MDSLSISTASSDKTIDINGSPISLKSGTIIFPAKQTTNPTKARKGLKFEGHRGAGLLEPENSMKAFRKGIELGLDGVELDVILIDYSI